MSDGVTVDTSELDVWGRILAHAGVEITVLNEAALTKAANQLKADARADAPVDTGDLQRSIRVYGGKEWRRVGSPLKQGFFQEFGTSIMAPQPWLYQNADKAGMLITKMMTNNGVKLIVK